MERRPYFVIGDLLCGAATGALVGVTANALVPHEWPMLAGMIIGMLVGALLAVGLTTVFMPLFGALEVMLPVMTTGMLAGMLVPMVTAARGLTRPEAALVGVVVGLSVLGSSMLLSWRLHGPAPHQNWRPPD